MVRYYEETALIEFVKQHTPHINGETTMDCVERAIREAPTADVAPKSEVERLETEVRLLTENSISAKYPCCVSCSKGLILTKSLEEYDKLLADISSEVARELLSDLKKAVHDKAIYTYSKELSPYVNLKVFDAVIADYLRRLEEKKYG